MTKNNTGRLVDNLLLREEKVMNIKNLKAQTEAVVMEDSCLLVWYQWVALSAYCTTQGNLLNVLALPHLSLVKKMFCIFAYRQ